MHRRDVCEEYIRLYRKPGNLSLTDRQKKNMTVKNVCRYCYNVMYNTSPLLLADQQMKIMRLHPRALRLAFTTENGEDMQKILCMFRNIYVENTECPIPKMDYTRGHFKRGVSRWKMVNIIVELSKYLIITIIIMYTYLCFRIFGYQDAEKKQRMLKRQNTLMFMLQLIAFMVLYLEMDDIKILGLYLAQMALFLATILLYTHIYPRVSRLVVNNMCMLLCIGLIMQTRLSYSKAMKQFVIAACAIALSLVIPIIIRKCKFLSEWRRIYAIIGLISLGVVVVIGQVSYGAMLGFTIAGINIQPSELVKIVFVFYVAASLKVSREFKDIVVTTAIAAFHVLILVVSKDLGAALIIFVVYLVMLYVATRQPLYILAGLGAGVASVVVHIICLVAYVQELSHGRIHLQYMTVAVISWHSLYLR